MSAIVETIVYNKISNLIALQAHRVIIKLDKLPEILITCHLINLAKEQDKKMD